MVSTAWRVSLSSVIERASLCPFRDFFRLLIVAARPIQLFSEIAHVGRYRNIMNPGFEAIIVPLPETFLALHLQHAAAKKHPDEHVRPGIRVAVDVDCVFVVDPVGLRNRCAHDAKFLEQRAEIGILHRAEPAIRVRKRGGNERHAYAGIDDGVIMMLRAKQFAARAVILSPPSQRCAP